MGKRDQAFPFFVVHNLFLLAQNENINMWIMALGEKRMVIYCCLEHVELALDIIVDEHEVAPILEEVQQSELSTPICEYCQNPALYMVSNEYS